MPLYEYSCKECDYVEEKIEFGEEIDSPHPCPKCGKEMKREFPSKMNFKLVYNNKTDVCSWGYDGYNSSQYWKDVNKARAEGKDVKPSNEN